MPPNTLPGASSYSPTPIMELNYYRNQDHYLIMSGLASYECHYLNCRSHFGTKFNLTRHIRAVHLSIKPFNCEICGLQLASKQTKREHLYVHTREKPFKCAYPECPKTYRQSSQLSLHRRAHFKNKNLFPTLELPSICKQRAESQRAIVLPNLL